MAYVSTVLESSPLYATHSKLTPPHSDPNATENNSDRRSTAISPSALVWKVTVAVLVVVVAALVVVACDSEMATGAGDEEDERGMARWTWV